MSLDTAINKTIPQKIKRFILGKERPNFMTRISVITGFFIWLYLFSWHLLTFLALILMSGIKPAWRNTVAESFSTVGKSQYNFTVNTLDLLFYHSLAQITIYTLILIGLLLIWRKKKIGFLIYTGGSIGTLLTTFFVMGASYLFAETTAVDFFLIGITTVYFGIGALWFYKWKSEDIKTQTES